MRSSFLTLAKSQTSFVAVPMIPLVDEGLVHLLQQHQTSLITTPYVGLRDAMSARSDSHRDALDGEVFRRDLDEMETDTVSERSPLLDMPSVHGRGQSRLEGEALPEARSIPEPT